MTYVAKLKRSLFLQVLCALFLGIAVGLAFHDFSLALKPLGDGFISLIKMLIAPIVFCVVVLGIYGANDIKNGQSRCKTILYFEVVTSIALILGIIVAYVFKPGVGMNIDITHLDAKDLSTYTERAHDMHKVRSFTQYYSENIYCRFCQRRYFTSFTHRYFIWRFTTVNS